MQLEKSEEADRVDRLSEHVRNGTTDQAPTQFVSPASHYTNPLQWEDEVRDIFRSLPLAIAFASEVSTKNHYKACSVLGLPIIVVRGEDGVVRTFLNACRHRGAAVAEPGCGSTRRFKCPFHGWTYDNAGKLRGVLAESTFGSVDPNTRSLVEFPTTEAVGIIWVTLMPDASPPDINAWLGDEIYSVLEKQELESWTVVETREMPGPNWKIAVEGYLENYHFQTLHEKSFSADFVGGRVGRGRKLTGIHSNIRAVQPMPSTPQVGRGVSRNRSVYRMPRRADATGRLNIATALFVSQSRIPLW